VAEVRINRWALERSKHLTNEVMLTIMDEVESSIINSKSKIFSSPSEAYALASRFRGTIYKHPYIKKKHEKVLRAIMDRCGEAYYEQNIDKLYIPRSVVEEWARCFQIPQERVQEYLGPLLCTGILEPSDRSEYLYKISRGFFNIVGPVAQYFVIPIDVNKFAGMAAIASGLTSIYVITHAVRSRKYGEEGLLIPSFLRLAMTYTLSGFEVEKMKIRDVLELRRMHAVDNFFVMNKLFPTEYWRSIRIETFEFMVGNEIIEGATPDGYRLNSLWVRTHEEGVKRYVQRVRERYERRLRGF